MPTLDDAIEMLRRGRTEEGMIILQRLRESHPDDLDVLYNLGMVYSDMGLLDKAIETLRPVAEKRGEVHDHTALGVAYLRNKQVEPAVAAFEAALKVDPNDFFALRNHAALLAQLGRIDEAIAAFGRAHERDPNAAEVTFGLGRAYESKSDLKTADEWYVKTLAIPGNSQAREMAKDARTRLAQKGMKEHGFNSAAMFYLLDAIQTFDGLSRDEVQTIAFDVALLGQRGLDIHDPAKKYSVKSLPDTYSGLQMLCFMYAGFKVVDPDLDAGIDLGEEYRSALEIRGGGETIDETHGSRPYLRGSSDRRRPYLLDRGADRQAGRVPHRPLGNLARLR
jgi:tetratricopeptide (TPR) repeat protein